MSQELLRSLVWMDYRLALLFLVVVPLVLSVWVLVRQLEAMQRLLVIYWRVSSLLAITVYLLIASIPVGFITGLMARILIPIGLWFWVDLNEEIEDQPKSLLKLVLTSWRWAASLYCALGAIAMLPILQCALSTTALNQPFCQVWQEPPFLFREFFHRNLTPPFLGFFGIVALVIYVLYLGYFVFVRLAKQGRIAIEQ
ncbi:DUF3177 family protein [Oscillatoria sp. FACHB-1407]|uniref:DUF3177 family protein n=1 Tax=Oscillatoria sp. FACHB-1407 TaxID=2692847 RepID=UPI001686F142|nr:DUF3177 family protein [Oscillatoria sp. FACHB-1407]MBD2462443.1 DUF3177 family protein [Oscillatoria sp. FACHB-1407]